MNKVNITHLKTIYKGCEPNGVKAIPSRSHVVRFCSHTMHSHATIMSLLSPAFLDAQQQYDEKFSDEPFHISILWPKHLDKKRKEENADTAYETVLYFVENMMAPRNGAIISIYHAHELKPWNTTQWRHSQIWPFEKQWDPQNEYITIHKVEPLMSPSRIKKVTRHEKRILPRIESEAEKYGFDIKYIDYTMPTKEIVETMTKSNYHFCYSGATMYTAAMIGIPSLSWHNYPQITNEVQEIRNLNNEIERHLVQVGTWGVMSNHNGKIRQYDFDNKCVNNFPNQNQRHLENDWDVDIAFIRMMK